MFHERGQGGFIFWREPGTRDFAQCLIEDSVGEVLDALDPGFKVGPAAHLAVDGWAIVKAKAGGIGEIPVDAIEAVALIDHGGNQSALSKLGIGGGFAVAHNVEQARSIEDALARVGVGGPLIECQRGGEMVNVATGGELHVGDDIVYGLQ